MSGLRGLSELRLRGLSRPRHNEKGYLILATVVELESTLSRQMVFPRMCAKQRVQIFYRSALNFDLKRAKIYSIETKESLPKN
jgi:hypothetical protein